MSTSSVEGMTPEQIVEAIGRPVYQEGGRYHCPVCGFSQKEMRLGPHMVAHWNHAGVSHPPHGSDRLDCMMAGCDYKATRRNLLPHLATIHHMPRAEASALLRTYGFDLADYRENGPSPAAIRYRAESSRGSGRRNRSDTAIPKVGDVMACPLDGCDFRTSKGKAGFGLHFKKAHHINTLKERNRLWDRTLDREAAKSAPSVPAVVEDEPAAVPASVEHIAGTSGWEHISADDAALAVVMSQVNGSISTELLPDVVTYIDRTRELFAKLKPSN